MAVVQPTIPYSPWIYQMQLIIPKYIPIQATLGQVPLFSLTYRQVLFKNWYMYGTIPGHTG